MSNEVTVKIGEENYLTTVEYGKHTIVADEPQDLGGKDAGPAPKALLLGALGTCKAITIKMYADRKEWPLKEVKIALDYEIKKSELQQTTYISCHLTFVGDLDEDQKKRLAVIAESCPVHKIFSNPIVITSNHL